MNILNKIFRFIFKPYVERRYIKVVKIQEYGGYGDFFGVKAVLYKDVSIFTGKTLKIYSKCRYYKSRNYCVEAFEIDSELIEI